MRERRYPRRPMQYVVASPIEIRMDSKESTEFSFRYGITVPSYTVRFPNGRLVEVDQKTWATLGRAWRLANA